MMHRTPTVVLFEQLIIRPDRKTHACDLADWLRWNLKAFLETEKAQANGTIDDLDVRQRIFTQKRQAKLLRRKLERNFPVDDLDGLLTEALDELESSSPRHRTELFLFLNHYLHAPSSLIRKES